jgi:cbb3-type cytochrome oxidase cytochrome c subunit
MKKYSSGCCFHLLYNQRIILKLAAAVTIIVAACGTALYIPAENQSTAGASYKDLLEGREIYINKCGGCHSLITPEKFEVSEWGKWVERMGPKAHISEDEKRSILAYLTKGRSLN